VENGIIQVNSMAPLKALSESGKVCHARNNSMTDANASPRRVLIVSANPLFREGLRKVYAERWGALYEAYIVGTPSTMESALVDLEAHMPDLVIVDYDDKTINRDEFLNRFVTGKTGNAPMQVMLVSLQESGQVVVYDRRTLTSAQAENWLNDPWSE
jgi:cytochrome c oxidase subunit 2